MSLEEYIEGIKIHPANLEHIAKTGRINGNLLIALKQAMTEYGNLCRNKAIEEVIWHMTDSNDENVNALQSLTAYHNVISELNKMKKV